MNHTEKPMDKVLINANNEVKIVKNKQNGEFSLNRVHEPVDRRNLVFIILYLWGLGTLLPWNFFITSQAYWMHKFRDLSANESVTADPIHRSDLQKYFTSYLSVASMVPNTLFLMLNTFLSRRIPQRIRLLCSLSLIIVTFFFSVSMTKVDTDLWQTRFFIITIISIVLLNCNSAIWSGGTFGMAGTFPFRCTEAVMNGQALGGIFAAVAGIITTSMGSDPTDSTFVYFSFALIILLVCYFAYFVLIRQEYYKYYTERVTSGRLYEDSSKSDQVSVMAVFLQLKMYAFSVCLVFTTTLAVFPGLVVLVAPKETTDVTVWQTKYFLPVLCFLVFNVGDFVGRTLAGMFQLPNIRGLLPGLCIARVVFIPLFILCNIQPRTGNLPVVFEHDSWFGLIMALFSISNGYLASMCMMLGPASVSLEGQETAGSMMATFLALGLMLGALLSNVLVHIP